MSARVAVVTKVGKMKDVDLHIDKRAVKPVAVELHAKEVLCVNLPKCMVNISVCRINAQSAINQLRMDMDATATLSDESRGGSG